MVDPIISMKRLTKVLMDGGSSLNIMYAETLDAMGIDWSCVRSLGAPFHGIVPGKPAMLLGTYLAILGQPCCAKFMAIPNYTYLKLKMLGLHGIITIGTTFQRAYECEVECYEHPSAIIAFEELTIIKDGTTEEAPDSKRSAGSFELAEGVKEVLIDPSSSEGKVVRIGTMLSSK
ncbi:uncharacterized protein [Miscanthus floridulus]|uniref:uncharacterized protein n=1 Tax=Miscanthus floridulus TaxID=154761 RepID=UPI00345799C4